MTIYVVMIYDRHTNPEAHLFSTIEKALDYVHQIEIDCYYTEEEAKSDDAVMSATSLKEAGWLYYRTLSPEGDCMWVLPKEIDDTK